MGATFVQRLGLYLSPWVPKSGHVMILESADNLNLRTLIVIIITDRQCLRYLRVNSKISIEMAKNKTYATAYLATSYGSRHVTHQK